MRRLVFLSFIISGLAFAQAKAQEMPAFAVPQIITADEIENLSVDFDESFNAIQNPYLSDTMKLNYQISLLDKLVTREAALTKIGESYTAIGMPFTPPPPPRGICAQLPPNGPCLASYPDLYGKLVEERKKHYEKIVVEAKNAEPGRKPNESDEAMIERQRKEAEERKRIAEEEARRTRYQWAELTCLSGECRGILVNRTDTTIRYTVRAGDRLPDGTVVESIRPGDVRVSLDGEMIKLRPAPGDMKGEQNPAVNALDAAMEASGLPSASESRAAAASIVANAGGAPQGELTSIESPPVNEPLPEVKTPAGARAATATVINNAEEAPLGPSGLF
jgi:hypothetical protein